MQSFVEDGLRQEFLLELGKLFFLLLVLAQRSIVVASVKCVCTFKDGLVDFVMEEIVILLVDVKDVLELIGNVVVLRDLIEILLETPKNLPDHGGRGKVVKP